MTAHNQKYSLHVSDSEIHFRQENNKTLVQSKLITTIQNLTEIQPSYLTLEMISKPRIFSKVKKNYYSNGLQF